MAQGAEDLGGKEVGMHQELGLVGGDGSRQMVRDEPGESSAQPEVTDPGPLWSPVEPLPEPIDEVGRGPYQVEVGLAVEAAEWNGGVVEQIDMQGLGPMGGEDRFQRPPGGDVTAADRGRCDEHTFWGAGHGGSLSAHFCRAGSRMPHGGPIWAVIA